MDFAVKAVLIGAGATLALDLWNLALNRTLGLPLPNWAFAGRWFANVAQGRVMHKSIAAAPPIRNETAIGWIGHYAVGIAFAAALLAIWGLDWARNPTLLPAMVVGYVTILCGWLIMQPGMGAGIAARLRPDANRARLLNVLGHTVFGLGLYATARLLA